MFEPKICRFEVLHDLRNPCQLTQQSSPWISAQRRIRRAGASMRIACDSFSRCAMRKHGRKPAEVNIKSNRHKDLNPQRRVSGGMFGSTIIYPNLEQHGQVLRVVGSV